MLDECTGVPVLWISRVLNDVGARSGTDSLRHVFDRVPRQSKVCRPVDSLVSTRENDVAVCPVIDHPKDIGGLRVRAKRVRSPRLSLRTSAIDVAAVI